MHWLPMLIFICGFVAYITLTISRSPRRRRRLTGLPFPIPLDPAKVVANPESGFLAPEGFSGRFNPTAHTALPAIQEAAVHAIFDLFRLAFIPGEYRSILREKPDPTDAWAAFCDGYGVNAEKLGNGDQREIGRLHETVGLLLELSELRPELKESDRAIILAELQAGHYQEAENLVDTARTIVNLLRNGVTLKSQIVFPHYRAFLMVLDTCLKKLDLVSPSDREDAVRAEQNFRECQNRFQGLINTLEQQIGWMAAYWPTNQWGKDNELIRDGIVRRKEELEQALRSDPDTHIPTLLDELDTLMSHLNQFIEEIKTNHGGGAFHPPPNQEAHRRWEEWRGAATFFGFSETNTPTRGDIKKKFRALALQRHPDRYTDPHEKESAHRKFQELNEARAVLDRYAVSGKPKKPPA